MQKEPVLSPRSSVKFTDHFGVLGGLTEKMPHLDVPPERGFVTEENFMRLYRRELG